jgi:transcriptional regulator with XRE-family HTH domain
MQKISELRLERGMTQEALANATGISLRTIQRIEQGQVKPRAYSLKKIAEVLEVDFNDLQNNDNRLISNLSNLYMGDRKQVFIGIFYSVWAALIFILLLLNITSQIIGNHFLDRSILFLNDFHIIRSAITFACIFALIQIYFLQLHKRIFSSVSYWTLLAAFSALTMYLKYISDFVSAAYSPLNNIQYYMSFICWLILLFLGVTSESLINAANGKPINQPDIQSE